MIDLSALEREKTHSLWKELDEGAGLLHLLLTISGTTASETISDLTTYEENPKEREIIENRYVSVLYVIFQNHYLYMSLSSQVTHSELSLFSVHLIIVLVLAKFSIYTDSHRNEDTQ